MAAHYSHTWGTVRDVQILPSGLSRVRMVKPSGQQTTADLGGSYSVGDEAVAVYYKNNVVYDANITTGNDWNHEPNWPWGLSDHGYIVVGIILIIFFGLGLLLIAYTLLSRGGKRKAIIRAINDEANKVADERAAAGIAA